MTHVERSKKSNCSIYSRMTCRSRASQQSGQALVLGLTTFVFVALSMLFVFHKMKNTQNTSLKHMTDIDEALKKCQTKANIINEIAIHNQNTLTLLAQAANTWAEASEWSLALANSRPYWMPVDAETNPESVFNQFSIRAKNSLDMAAKNSQTAQYLSRVSSA